MTKGQKTNKSDNLDGVTTSKSNGSQAAETPVEPIKGVLDVPAPGDSQAFSFTEAEQAILRPLQAAADAAHSLLADIQIEIVRLEAQRAEAVQNIANARKALSDGVVAVFQDRKIPLDVGHWNVDTAAMTATRTQ